MGSSQLGIELTPSDASAIASFLRALTGKQPAIEYPLLPPHTKDTPLPYVAPGPLSKREPPNKEPQ
jgi:cytochrome c peroxidase